MVATVTQPLLRGFGRAVNEAPIKRARFNETRNSLELRRTLTEQITQASSRYRALARAQEALRIQQLSLENQRQQLEFVQVLVNAGRRARADLVEVEANIASTQTQLIAARNALDQAKSDLLNLLDIEETLDIAVPQELIEEFKTGAIPVENLNALTLNRLLEIAYTNRPEYLQAKSSIEIAELDLLVARDNKRFGLDLQLSASLGDNSQMSTGISLTRVFEDQSLETAFQQNRVDLLKRQNDLAKIADDIQIEVESRLRDVNSSRDRITAARRARELAERRLEITRERFRLGREDIFQVISLQNAVVTAQNEEVNAKIDFLDAVTRLDQASGLTLDTWKEQVAASGLLVTSP
jgi:outer membrane protein TolC